MPIDRRLFLTAGSGAGASLLAHSAFSDRALAAKRIVADPEGTGLHFPTAAGEIDADAFGLSGDGVRDNTELLSRLIDIAMASGRGIVFSGPGDYLVAASIRKALTGPLRMRALAGARLIFDADQPGALDLRADIRSAKVRLAAAAEPASMSLKLVNPGGIAAGDVVTLSTSTTVCSTFPGYHKIATVPVAEIAANGTIILRDPLNFHFDVEETTVSIYKPAVLSIDGFGLKANRQRTRLDIWGIRGARIENCGIEGAGRSGVNFVLFVMHCVDLACRNLSVRDAVYGMSIGGGTRNTRIEAVRSANCHHPIDPHTWAHGVHIRDITGVGNGTTVNCHPAFEVWYEGVRESAPDGVALSLRTIGGGLKNAWLDGPAGHRKPGVVTVGLLRDFDYLMSTAVQHFENVHAPTLDLGVSECAKATIRNCTFASIGTDGHSNRVGSIEISSSRGVDRMRRVKRLSNGQPIALPVRMVDDGGRTWQTLDVKDDVNLGYVPILSYRAELITEEHQAGAALRIPVRLFHHYGIQEEYRRSGTIALDVAFGGGENAYARYRYDCMGPTRFSVQGETNSDHSARISIAGSGVGHIDEVNGRPFYYFDFVVHREAADVERPRIRLEVREVRS